MSRRTGFFPLILWPLLFVWLVLLIGLSVSPLRFKIKLHTIGHYHDFDHYVVYLLTSLLICQITKRPWGRCLGFLFAFAIALGQEWLENRIYHAGYEWRDVATDLAGIVSGFALVTLFSVLFHDSQVSRSR